MAQEMHITFFCKAFFFFHILKYNYISLKKKDFQIALE